MNDFKDMSILSDEDLLNWMEEDPQEFVKNLAAQIKSETIEGVSGMLQDRAELQKKNDITKKINSTFETYAKKNPDFDKMWESGELKKYMDENPGHNAMGAHMALKLTKRIQDTKAKQAHPQNDPRLHDVKASGGLTRVIADRLNERRSTKEGTQKESGSEVSELVATVSQEINQMKRT
jgi:hypothetical protein